MKQETIDQRLEEMTKIVVITPTGKESLYNLCKNVKEKVIYYNEIELR